MNCTGPKCEFCIQDVYNKGTNYLSGINEWHYTVPPTVGPNSKVKDLKRRLGFCLTYIWVSSKNSKIKYSTNGPLRKLKNLAKKLSDFDKNLTTQKTICVDLLVKISSESDKFLAKFLLWNVKG